VNLVAVARSVFVRLAWLVVAAAVALGGAGIVAAMHHVPGSDARAELTWAGDAQAAPVLDDVTARLQQVSDDVDTLGSTARQALAAVVAGDAERVNETIAAGSLQLASVKGAVASLEARLGEVPGLGTDADLRLSPALQDRYDALRGTPALTDDLEADWTRFSGLALDATNLGGLLTRHDQETAAAARQGAVGKYQTALDLLDVSDATVRETMAVRDRLAATTDVSTLTTWLERNASYDAALRTLYQALQDANGELNDEIRAAFAAEQAARERLPVDTRPLIVIMADVAQGGLNQAVIRIEEARGALGEALDEQRRLDEEVALPE
jgi:alkylhydroperoxidase/carboxymuconolactone decarboxylase family protein YurZ